MSNLKFRALWAFFLLTVVWFSVNAKADFTNNAINLPLSITGAASGEVLVFDGTNWVDAAISGDCTLAAGGAITCVNADYSFVTIAVSGQSDVVAEAASDTLTLVAGSGISITTNAGTDTVTITNSSIGLSDADYGDIVVSGSGTVMTIDAGIIVNADVNASAAISATKLVDGTVTDAELQYINTLSSNAQTQIDGKQASDAFLTSIAGLGTAADRILYTTGVDTAAETAISAYARGFIDDADEATLKSTLNLEAGTDYNAYDADLTTYAGITPSANVQTLLGSADYSAFKTSLSLNNVENTALSTWAGSTNITTLGTVVTGTWNATDVPLSAGGTGATLADPGADRIMFWDDSAGAVTWLTAGSGLTITDTTITATASGGASWSLVTQDAAITLDSATHNGHTVELTGSTNRTWAFTAAATLTSSWAAILVNSGTAELTLDPDGAETIDGLATFKMYPGEARLVTCTGSAFKSIVLNPFYLTVAYAASPFTFTKPPGYREIDGRLGAGGGSGGKGNTQAGSGGGGGASHQFSLASSTVGTTETVTIGAGGAAQASTNTVGNVGGNSTFGSLVTSYGGGGGGAGGGTNNGGGGGGIYSVGTAGGITSSYLLADYLSANSGTTPTPGNGGLPNPGLATASQPSWPGYFGGGAGGAESTDPGGPSVYGGAGGGFFGTTTVQGANGGASKWGGGGGAGGAQDSAPGAGSGGTSTLGGGNGGAGAYDANNGTDGTAGSNGGGGGGGGGSESGSSGAGGNGSAAIWGKM